MPAAEPDDRRPEEELASLTPAIASRLKMRSLHDLVHDIAAHRLEAARVLGGMVSWKFGLVPISAGDVEDRVCVVGVFL
jgi:hypothetical protein